MSAVADLYAALADIPTQRRETSAGTPGDGYMTTGRPHRFVPEPPEYGRRPLCAVCGAEKPGHDAVPVPGHDAVPVPRAGDGAAVRGGAR